MEEKRKAFVRRKAFTALQEGGKFGCKTWAKLKSTAAQYGFSSWQQVPHVCVSADGTRLHWKADRHLQLSEIIEVDIVREPVQTYSELGERQYQLVIHSQDRSPLVLNTADAACFDAWGFSLRVLVPGLTEFSTEPGSGSCLESVVELVKEDDVFYADFEPDNEEIGVLMKAAAPAEQAAAEVDQISVHVNPESGLAPAAPAEETSGVNPEVQSRD